MSNYNERCGYLAADGTCSRIVFASNKQNIICDPETEAICEEEDEQAGFIEPGITWNGMETRRT